MIGRNAPSDSAKREKLLAALRAALIDGENSGPSTAFDFDAFVAGKIKAPGPHDVDARGEPGHDDQEGGKE